MNTACHHVAWSIACIFFVSKHLAIHLHPLPVNFQPYNFQPDKICAHITCHLWKQKFWCIFSFLGAWCAFLLSNSWSSSGSCFAPQTKFGQLQTGCFCWGGIVVCCLFDISLVFFFFLWCICLSSLEKAELSLGKRTLCSGLRDAF